MPARSFLFRLLFISVLLIVPLFGFLAFKWPISTDFIFCATLLKIFSSQFWTGELYPRWLMDANAGFGSPIFLFYSPLPFYAGSLLEWLAAFDQHGFYRLVILMWLPVFFSGIACYRWLQLHVNEADAQKGALLYAGFPYILTVIYEAFGLAQLWALVFLPLLLAAADDVQRKDWRAIPKFSILYALLCLTHLPSTIIFAAVPWCYVVALAPQPLRWRHMAIATASALLGMGLTAVYLAPLWEILFSQGNDQRGYVISFIHMTPIIAVTVILLPLIAFYFEMPKHLRRGQLTPPIRFWIAVIALFSFMASPFSKPLWEIFFPLQYLSFPFRFFLYMLPGAVFIAVHWLPHVKSRGIYPVLFIIIASFIIPHSFHTFFYEKEAPVRAVLENNAVPFSDFLARWTHSEDVDTLHLPEHWLTMPAISFQHGDGKAILISNQPRVISFRATVHSPEAKVLLRRFYFPGWQAPQNLTIEPHHGALSVVLPKGDHEITLALPWYPGEQKGVILSFVALVMWSFLWLRSRHPALITRV